MKAGAAWELALEIWNRQYQRDGLAYVVRCHPEAKVMGGSLIFSEKGPPDFMGAVQGGKLVCFDAKETSAARLSFVSIKRHQAAALSAVDAAGGVAFIAARFLNPAAEGPKSRAVRGEKGAKVSAGSGPISVVFLWRDIEMRWREHRLALEDGRRAKPGEGGLFPIDSAARPIPPTGWLSALLPEVSIHKPAPSGH